MKTSQLKIRMSLEKLREKEGLRPLKHRRSLKPRRKDGLVGAPRKRKNYEMPEATNLNANDVEEIEKYMQETFGALSRKILSLN